MTFTEQLRLNRDPSTGRYIIMFDASAYKESNCMRKMWYTVFRGLRREGKDFKMEYGTAFHKALQHYYATYDQQKSIEIAMNHYMSPEIVIPDNDFRSGAHLMNCLMQYFAENKHDVLKPMVLDGVPLLEQKFAIPFYQDDLVEVLICGTIDMIGTFAGMPVIVDHKTTSQWNTTEYMAGYDLSPQLMMYNMIYNRLFKSHAVIPQSIGCMINGIFLVRSNKNVFKRSEIRYFTPTQLLNFERELKRKVLSFVESFRELVGCWDRSLDTTFAPNYTCCETKYGQCSYSAVCSTDSEDSKESLISNMFITSPYQPLAFQT